jgi:hypothetical protein
MSVCREIVVPGRGVLAYFLLFAIKEIQVNQ